MNPKTNPFHRPFKFRFMSWMRAVTPPNESDASDSVNDNPSLAQTLISASTPFAKTEAFARRRGVIAFLATIMVFSQGVISPVNDANAQTSYPAPAPPSSYAAPPSLQGSAGASTYGQSAYGQSAYGTQPTYGAPQQSYGEAQPSYGAAQPSYGAAQPSYGAAQPGASNPYAAPTYSGGTTYQGGGTLSGPLQDSFPSSPNLAPPVVTQPTVREADLIIQGYPARTGRLMFGGAVNSDAGVTGQITIDERNFDISRWPRSFSDMFSGTAFRGAGQTFRLEAAPGSDFQRYTLQFADPNLLGYLPISMSLSGFLYDRNFNDWDENRLGGRASFGYRVTPDLSVSVGFSGQNVEISDPRVNTVQQLNDVVGDNALYSGMASLIHDTRNSPLQPSRGHYFELSFEQTFGDFDYSTFEAEYRKYFLLRERADGSGKQTLSFGTQLGFSGDETPIFENYFAGGYSTIRGFDFRGASPVINGVEVGGRFQWLNTVEYMFPLTADDAFRGVAFVDFGTVEQDIEIDADNFRVAPGFGFRVAIPMLGPAPLAFDFAFPVAKSEFDDERMFSFYMSAIR
ncbi:BamA/TamA family outer membrane protein [Rhodopirellula halodulae]|uniref:BamA/OMP85 family outer membrane protein n=1 Tax=Rhodopirellula halodulae TaxID=2894198 RepID=UPI003F689475